jgi:hypothetical protein
LAQISPRKPLANLADAVVSEHDEDEEDAEASGGHDEEVDRDQVADVLARNVRQV